MTEQGMVMGRWTRLQTRCHRCNRPVKQVYRVIDPPITGNFCSRNCYEQARALFEAAPDEIKNQGGSNG